jgi:hypothetical protein
LLFGFLYFALSLGFIISELMINVRIFITISQVRKTRKGSVTSQTIKKKFDEKMIKAVRISILVPVTFIIFICPQAFSILYQIFTSKNSPPLLDKIAVIFLELTFFSDFLIFAILDVRYNKGIRKIFRKWFLNSSDPPRNSTL